MRPNRETEPLQRLAEIVANQRISPTRNAKKIAANIKTQQEFRTTRPAHAIASLIPDEIPIYGSLARVMNAFGKLRVFTPEDLVAMSNQELNQRNRIGGALGEKSYEIVDLIRQISAESLEIS